MRQILFLILLFSFQLKAQENQIKPITILRGHSNDVSAARFSPGKFKIIATGTWNQQINIFKADSPFSLIKAWKAHEAAVNCIAFSFTGNLIASGGRDFQIHIWDSLYRIVPLFEDSKLRHEANINTLLFDRGGKFLFSGCEAGKIIIWDIQAKKAVKQLNTGISINCFAPYTNPSSIFIAGAESKIKLLNLSNGQIIKTFDGHTDIVNSIAISKNYKYLLSGSNDKTARLWDLKTFKQIRILPVNCWKVTAVAFSDDSKYCLTACNDGSIKVWETETGKLISQIEEQNFNIRDISFNQNSDLICAAAMMKNSDDYGPRIYRSSIPQQINLNIQSKSKREFDSLWSIKPFNRQDSIKLKLVNSLPGLSINKENQKVIKQLDSVRIYKTPMINLKK
jgi:WD40 repeat protein